VVKAEFMRNPLSLVTAVVSVRECRIANRSGAHAAAVLAVPELVALTPKRKFHFEVKCQIKLKKPCANNCASAV
jgi:hypothetical protein